MAAREILLLGNERLYEISEAVTLDDFPQINDVACDLADTLAVFRQHYGFGRAIAAPQIGVAKRMIHMNVGKPITLINPVLTFDENEMDEIWDDCMSFPDLMVRVFRYPICRVEYRDLKWMEQRLDLSGDLAHLIQHEYDHLDGILAVQRAIDKKSFALRSEIKKNDIET